MNGSCRFGSRCIYRHEWPVMPSTVPCRYFQKGGCWYGERCRWATGLLSCTAHLRTSNTELIGIHCTWVSCTSSPHLLFAMCSRYLHVLQPNDGAVVTGRRASAADVHSPLVGNVLSERRGSEPALPRVQGISSQEHRESASALVNVSNLQHNFGHLTTDISQEVVSWGLPFPHQGIVCTTFIRLTMSSMVDWLVKVFVLCFFQELKLIQQPSSNLFRDQKLLRQVHPMVSISRFVMPPFLFIPYTF